MGKITGFLEIHRAKPKTRAVAERIRDWKEVYLPMAEQDLRNQGARCMDCSIPFCHQGCPLGNIIPDWNDLVYKNRWRDAIDRCSRDPAAFAVDREAATELRKLSEGQQQTLGAYYRPWK